MLECILKTHEGGGYGGKNTWVYSYSYGFLLFQEVVGKRVLVCKINTYEFEALSKFLKLLQKCI